MDIKICGLRRTEDAEYINAFDAIKYAGFVFAKSKRQITVETAINIKKYLRRGLKTVGVFADMPFDDVRQIADEVQLDIIQLHSNETVQYCSELKNSGYSIWKSIAVERGASLDKAAVYFDSVDGFVLDKYDKSAYGGTGISFDWNAAHSFSDKYYTILAGGINSENILQAYSVVKPNVIDLSSSVETDGFKDYKKIERLIGRLN